MCPFILFYLVLIGPYGSLFVLTDYNGPYRSLFVLTDLYGSLLVLMSP